MNGYQREGYISLNMHHTVNQTLLSDSLPTDHNDSIGERERIRSNHLFNAFILPPLNKTKRNKLIEGMGGLPFYVAVRCVCVCVGGGFVIKPLLASRVMNKPGE